MVQNRFDLKVNGKYITLDQLYDLAKEEIIDALDYMNNEDALYLGNHIREESGDYDQLYENNEEGINEVLDGWSPWDCIQLDYDNYAEFFYLCYGEPEFTNDVWVNLDTDDIAEDILDGSYSSYLDDDIKEVLDDYEEAKEFLENLNPYRAKGEEVIARFMNCEADVTDLLQYIDKLVRDDNAWKEE